VTGKLGLILELVRKLGRGSDGAGAPVNDGLVKRLITGATRPSVCLSVCLSARRYIFFSWVLAPVRSAVFPRHTTVHVLPCLLWVAFFLSEAPGCWLACSSA
jgi:hypothetical protein